MLDEGRMWNWNHHDQEGNRADGLEIKFGEFGNHRIEPSNQNFVGREHVESSRNQGTWHISVKTENKEELEEDIENKGSETENEGFRV